MLNKSEGLMSVDEAEKLINKVISSYEQDKQKAQEEFKNKIESFRNRINSFGFLMHHTETEIIRKQVLEILDEELFQKEENENYSPSQQASVDKREVCTCIKKISDVGENPISDTFKEENKEKK
jgi:polyhydroxyalkanoate synthesis regulator phasin